MAVNITKTKTMTMTNANRGHGPGRAGRKGQDMMQGPEGKGRAGKGDQMKEIIQQLMELLVKLLQMLAQAQKNEEGKETADKGKGKRPSFEVTRTVSISKG